MTPDANGQKCPKCCIVYVLRLTVEVWCGGSGASHSDARVLNDQPLYFIYISVCMYIVYRHNCIIVYIYMYVCSGNKSVLGPCLLVGILLFSSLRKLHLKLVVFRLLLFQMRRTCGVSKALASLPIREHILGMFLLYTLVCLLIFCTSKNVLNLKYEED